MGSVNGENKLKRKKLFVLENEQIYCVYIYIWELLFATCLGEVISGLFLVLIEPSRFSAFNQFRSRTTSGSKKKV